MTCAQLFDGAALKDMVSEGLVDFRHAFRLEDGQVDKVKRAVETWGAFRDKALCDALQPYLAPGFDREMLDETMRGLLFFKGLETQ